MTVDPKLSQGPEGTRPAQGYAGDVAPQLAYEWWRTGDAVLVDVRSDAEREWVGFALVRTVGVNPLTA